MQEGFRLLDLAGKVRTDISLSSCAVITIDAQEEYRSGILALPGIDAAIQEGVAVLHKARALKLPILHIAHRGAPGAKTFAADSPCIQIFSEFQVQANEPVIYKSLPNAFTGTTLLAELQQLGSKHLILFGFMTHMCVSTTARAAIDHGYLSTIIANACGTRNLIGIDGSVIPAEQIHASALAELADRFSFIVPSGADLFLA